MLFTLLYDFALALYVLALLPVVFFQMATKGKYRKNFLRRFGFGIPKIRKQGRKVIWLHAVSVGEIRAIAALGKGLKEFLGDAALVISTATETGYAESRRSLPFADFRLYLPLDFSFLARMAMERIRPDLFLLSETDFWYHHLKYAREVGAKTALVNGKISERSFKRFKKNQWLARRVFALVDLFCVQDHDYRQRFEKLGVPSGKIRVTGNLKYDQIPERMSEACRKEFCARLKIQPQDTLVTIGSTHASEEDKILTQLQSLFHHHSHLKILLVPRHPERFDAVAQLVVRKGFSMGRYSKPSLLTGKERVIVIDAMGVLRNCYELSSMAVMGGSFEPIGGHNALEAVAVGVPVLMGPYMFAQKDMAAMVVRSGAGRQVTLDNLEREVAALLTDPERNDAIRDAGAHLIASCAGTAARTQEQVLTLFET